MIRQASQSFMTGAFKHRKLLVRHVNLKPKNALKNANIAIAHTRWTHGEPSEKNAHPHTIDDHYAVIHNGIIENHAELKNKYQLHQI